MCNSMLPTESLKNYNYEYKGSNALHLENSNIYITRIFISQDKWTYQNKNIIITLMKTVSIYHKI